MLNFILNSLEITLSQPWVVMIVRGHSPPGQKTESPYQIPGVPLIPPPLGRLPPPVPPQARPHPACQTLWGLAPLTLATVIVDVCFP